MEFVANMFGTFELVIAAFATFFIAGNLPDTYHATARRNLAYIFGSRLLTMDLLLRAFALRRIAARKRSELIYTREGPIPKPRNYLKEVCESLIDPRAGGQYFWLLPTWIAGAAVAVIAFVWEQPWFRQILHST